MAICRRIWLNGAPVEFIFYALVLIVVALLPAMEIAGMENQTNVSDVLKREVESERKNLKSSAQLRGILHMYSGNGDASYSENSTRQSIHFLFSIMALHRISEVPERVLNKDSPLYNKGKVWINRGRQDIVDLYSKQSQKDLTTFMRCRADEMAEGGVLFLYLLGRPDSSHPAQQISVGGELCGQDFEDAWDDLVTKGIISLDLRDSFNLPWYFPNVIEVRAAVEECGGFDVERVEVCEGVPTISEEEFKKGVNDPNMFAKTKANLVKSIVGCLLAARIGLLFQRFEKSVAALLHSFPPSRFVTCTVASLVRK